MSRNPSAPELAVVVPTFNERDNIAPLLLRLKEALDGIRYEVIFVDDDSPDGTSDEVRSHALADPRVRLIRRVNRRGLSSACLEGMMATVAPYIAVMDADLQHDETILPLMLRKIQEQDLDLVVATRHSEGGSVGDFPIHRIWLSNLGRRLSRLVSRVDLSDPMSGFFLVRRDFVEEVVRSASGLGFKILLDLVSSSRRPVRFAEVPYTFRKRHAGQSKLDSLVSLEYMLLLVDKTMGRFVPPRFVLFSMVGAVGVVVAVLVLWVLLDGLGMAFFPAQITATYCAMVSNFFLNNLFTYRDRRLKGTAVWTGLLTFCIACSLGAVLNVRFAGLLVQLGSPGMIAGTAGLAVGAVWNYGVSSFTTWRQERKRAVDPNISSE